VACSYFRCSAASVYGEGSRTALIHGLSSPLYWCLFSWARLLQPRRSRPVLCFPTIASTSEYKRLDIRRLRQEGVFNHRNWLTWQWTLNDQPYGNINILPESNRLTLSYRHRTGGEWKSERYPVLITQTHCHFGGVRQWFLCSARGCTRRVAVLYGGGIFACRHCHQLAYDSQCERVHERALSRAQKLHVRLGGSGAVGDGLPPKPTGMHWKTYRGLANRFLRDESVMDAAAAALFGLAF
jgi:hypothetical protein